ncbi:MFS general substrate transporter [Cristinia sonorae]|uniref:MFS general substrate transporter n=1 Tax=Cristinia sonorae TaxID=1940300 RepID=A0A8K0UQF3_9AGAR|nr:MFS general substrate transporter [Cristinia sonorae]
MATPLTSTTRPPAIRCDASGATSTSLPDSTHGYVLPTLSTKTRSSSFTLVSEIDTEKTPHLSTLRLLFAHIGAALTLFLATTDATIVSTILPTIVKEFNATQLEYTWVGVSYMLTQTAFQPLYGKLSDLVGRRTVLFSSMCIFVIGSMLCGGAKSMLWLILARALAGIGAGGIVSLVWTITSEIVDVQSRAKWSQALSVTWCCSAISGPLLGGLFSGQSGLLSWRWAFYLNLPVCLFALVVLCFSLRPVRMGPVPDMSWQKFLHRFDFIGLVLFMAGSSCIIVGFSFASLNGWRRPSTICLVVGGLVVLACGGVYEVRTSRDALFPPSAFKNLTTIMILIINFLHQFVFTSGTFYLALYFQLVQGLRPLHAGITMLPYSLGSSLASMPTAWFIGYWQKRTLNMGGQRLMISAGLLLSAAGFGLMVLLNEHSKRAPQVLYPLLAGVGLGMLFHAPYQVFTRTLQTNELASGTSAFFLVRFTGATTGLAVSGAILHSRMYHTLPKGVPLSLDVGYVASTLPADVKTQAVHSVSLSLQAIWILCSPLLGSAFLISIFLRNMPIERNRCTDQESSISTMNSENTALSVKEKDAQAETA